MKALQIDNYVITTPLLEVINRLRLVLTNGKLKDVEPKGDNIVVTCPNPSHSGGHESSPACNVYVGDDGEAKYGYFRCFVCEEQGSFIKFVAECFDSSEDFAKKWLISNFGEKAFDVAPTEDPIDLDIALKKPKAKKFVDRSVLDQYQDYCPYLAKRKLSKETCQRLHIKYDAKYRQIVFPCFDRNGNIITLLRRSIDTKQFYIDKDIAMKPVYGLGEIEAGNSQSCLITEGLFDRAVAEEYGCPAMACLGTPSKEQIDAINRSCVTTLYLAFDNDEAGMRFNQIFHQALSKRILLLDVVIPHPAKDVGDLSYDAFWKAVDEAK